MDDVAVSPTPPDKHSEEPLDAGSPSTTPGTLQYDRITQDRHIRVLDLAPGSWDEPVTCSLRTVDPDADELHYEAISYAWGDPADRKTVMCNGCAVSTTRNLFEALQRFRRVDNTRTLWADALCINQADHDEKTYQVRLMSFIYRRAARVLVWLQHEDDHVVQDSLNVMCQFAGKEDPHGKWGDIEDNAYYKSSELYQWRGVAVISVSGDEPAEIADAATDALRHMCSSPWFSRGWVIQEAALGTSVSVFWGHAEIDLRRLNVVSSVCMSLRFHRLTRATLSFRHLFDLRMSHRIGYYRQSWFTLSYMTRFFTFSEPKDRIYGLLGLETVECDSTKGQLLVDPDYNIDILECYRRVATKLLCEWHDLRVLSWAGHRPGPTQDWPSWVPDWKPSGNHMFQDLGGFDRIKEKSNLTDISDIMRNGNHCINIAGLRVDTVLRVVDEHADMTDIKDDSCGPVRLQALLRSLAHVYREPCLACTFGNQSKYLSLPSYRMENLLDNYHAFMNRDFTQDMYRHVPVESNQDDQRSSFTPNADKFFETCRRDNDGHTLFITNTEMLGQGPDNILPGDVVVVLHGSAIPFVLRPASDGLWRLVGECYVYDVNEGRILREWEEKGSVSEKFCIH